MVLVRGGQIWGYILKVEPREFATALDMGIIKRYDLRMTLLLLFFCLEPLGKYLLSTYCILSTKQTWPHPQGTCPIIGETDNKQVFI